MLTIAEKFQTMPLAWCEGFIYCIRDRASEDALDECLNYLTDSDETYFYEGWKTAKTILKAHNDRLNKG